ncbi:hypothetical protein REPUB_Repub13aG0200300 [Reevesia pubescens]
MLDRRQQQQYQTRAAQNAVVTSDWLSQAQAAVGRHPDDGDSSGSDLRAGPTGGGVGGGKAFSVINEFNSWRKQPDLAEALFAPSRRLLGLVKLPL